MSDETIEKIELMAELISVVKTNGTILYSEQNRFEETLKMLNQIYEIQTETGVIFFESPFHVFTADKLYDSMKLSAVDGWHSSEDFYKYNSLTMFVNPNRKLTEASQCLYLDVNGVPVFAVYQNGKFQMFIENYFGKKRKIHYSSEHFPCEIPYDERAVLYGKVIGDGEDSPLRFIAHEIVELEDGIIRYAKTYEQEIDLMRSWGFETVPVAFLERDDQKEISMKALEKMSEIFEIPAGGCLLIS